MKIIEPVSLSNPYQTPNISNSQTPKMNRFIACSQIKYEQTERGRGLVVCSVCFEIGLSTSRTTRKYTAIGTRQSIHWKGPSIKRGR